MVAVQGECCQKIDCGAIVAPGGGQCVYNNRRYSNGQTWDDGCDYKCECTNAYRGEYKCSSRCPVYGVMPVGCKMVTDVYDACCKVPDCAGYSLGYTPEERVRMQSGQKPGQPTQPDSGMIPRLPDTGMGIKPTGQKTGPDFMIYPDPEQPTGVDPSVPGSISDGSFQGGMKPKKAGYCLYKNKYYTQGQHWEDGCDYSCDCVSAQMGYYRCVSRCPTYGKLPQGCKMVAVQGECCQKVDCGAIVTPGGGQCVYNNRRYSNGQTWDDGCDYKCECTNAYRGEYKCSSRCAVYGVMPVGCKMVTDVYDACCKVPECSGYSLGYTPEERVSCDLDKSLGNQLSQRRV